MFIRSIGTSLFEVLPLWTVSPKIDIFFHSFVDTCIGTICHHKDFAGWVLRWENFISPRNNLFHTQKCFFSGKAQIPKWAPFAPNGTANQIAGNPGTTVVSIGHLTTWPENPGYHTQVWDKHSKCTWKLIILLVWSCTQNLHTASTSSWENTYVYINSIMKICATFDSPRKFYTWIIWPTKIFPFMSCQWCPLVILLSTYIQFCPFSFAFSCSSHFMFHTCSVSHVQPLHTFSWRCKSCL